MHSTTKYLNGHSDVVGGAIVFNDKKIGEQIRFLANALGASEIFLTGESRTALRYSQMSLLKLGQTHAYSVFVDGRDEACILFTL